jgi:hypothetical protein
MQCGHDLRAFADSRSHALDGFVITSTDGKFVFVAV